MVKTILLSIALLLCAQSVSARPFFESYQRPYGYERESLERRYYPHRECAQHCTRGRSCKNPGHYRWCILKCSSRVDMKDQCGRRRYFDVIDDLRMNRHLLNSEDQDLLSMILNHYN